MIRSRLTSSLLVGAFATVFAGSAHALTFVFNPAAGTPINVQNGFAAAGARWSAIFADPITINVNIAFPSLGAGILGQTGSAHQSVTYGNFRTALAADASSATDTAAVGSLPNTASISGLIDFTSTNSAVHSISTSNLMITNANAKAVGLLAANNAAVDASIQFSSNFSWDFDPSNGITAGQFDFVGVATHEIGHCLGFESVVDELTSFSPNQTDGFYGARVNSLDLFRYSASGTRSWTSGGNNSNAVRYFSTDSGATNEGRFALGPTHGDGDQASHWRDGLGIGIMDPTAAPGELMTITGTDIKGFDAIGYTLTPVPEPATMAALGLGTLALLRRRRKA